MAARDAEVRERAIRRHAAPRRPVQEPLADQERLVGLLDGLGLLADGVRERREADGVAVEAHGEHLEDRPVDLVEAELVDAEEREPLLGDLLG